MDDSTLKKANNLGRRSIQGRALAQEQSPTIRTTNPARSQLTQSTFNEHGQLSIKRPASTDASANESSAPPKKKRAKDTTSATLAVSTQTTAPQSKNSSDKLHIVQNASDRRLIFDLVRYANLVPALGARYQFHGLPMKSKAPARDTKENKDLDLTKPPLSDINVIFGHMAKKLGECDMDEACRAINNRRLRIFTMCSGTEAPVFALRKLKNALAGAGTTFDFDHVASVEIVPFKQAFIAANSDPDIIFRDVTDFSNDDDKMTIYGAAEPAPVSIDILVAGSSCVDYSNLNKSPKEFKIDGESWFTMKGVADYANKHRPRVVILENVRRAPWPAIKAYWQTFGYLSTMVPVDTKDFYIPQTRERGYMFAIDATFASKMNFDCGSAFTKFQQNVLHLEHRASSPYTDFVHFPDDPRYEQRTRDVVPVRSTKSGKNDWVAGMHRYNKLRADHQLGPGRPVSNRQSSGTSQLPDYLVHRPFIVSMGERVLDTLDIFKLRYFTEKSFDVFFKNRIVDLSQNADRECDAKRWGIQGCITPDGRFFDFLRSGILSGQELLGLQGLSADELVFPSDSLKDLADLAGNAMTTTVVGSIIAAAISASCQKDKHGLTSLFATSGDAPGPVPDASSAKIPTIEQITEAWEKTNMRHHQQRLFDSVTSPTKTFIEQARQSRQLCLCERYSELHESQFFICTDCGHTACASCKGNPVHSFIELWSEKRISPSNFIAFLEDELPRSLQMALPDDLDAIEGYGPSKSTSKNQRYRNQLRLALTGIYHYDIVKRSSDWKIEYISPFGRLELRFTPSTDISTILAGEASRDEFMSCQWLLFATCGSDEPGNSPMRAFFSAPVARMQPCTENILRGEWKMCNPRAPSIKVSVAGFGALQPSYESRIGIEALPWKDSREVTTLLIKSDDRRLPKRTELHLIGNCEAPHASIYRSVQPIPHFDNKTVYLLIDAQPLQDAGKDSYVLTFDPRRKNNHEQRQTIVKFPPSWRLKVEHDRLDSSKVCDYTADWILVPWMSLVATEGEKADVWLSETKPVTSQYFSKCKGHDTATIGIKVPVPAQFNYNFRSNTSFTADLAGRHGVFRPLEWLLTKLRIPSFAHEDEWEELGPMPAPEESCGCHPKHPRLNWHWTWANGHCKTMVVLPFEDKDDAREFEHAIKRIPSAAHAVVYCHQETVLIEVHLKPQTLLHQALKAIRPSNDDESVSLQWRARRCRDMESAPKFLPDKLKNNVDEPCAHPDCSRPELVFDLSSDDFGPKDAKRKRRTLWKSQKNLVTWALHQESGCTKWFEQEYFDVQIPPLQMSLEARAILPTTVRGGVIADQVGAGKTTSAIALAATDKYVLSDDQNIVVDPESGRILSNATLILVPSNLLGQWTDEMQKCLPEKEFNRVRVIYSMEALVECDIDDFVGRKIVVASWELLDDDDYWRCLRVLSYSPNTPFYGGRAFGEWQQLALANLAAMFKKYRSEDPKKTSFWQQRLTGKDRLLNYQDFPAFRSREDHNKNRKAGANMCPSKPDKTGVTHVAKFRPNPNEVLKDNENLDKRLDAEMSEWPTKFGRSALSDSKPRIYALFHAFRFQRVMVDEFQYLKGLSLRGVMSLTANNRWLLSGTPPINSVSGIHTMARLLGTKITNEDVAPEYLGADGKTPATVRSRSYVEQFLQHKRKASPGIQINHQKQANNFLDVFVRQNSTDLSGCRREDKYIVFDPSPLEYATFLEFLQLILSHSMRFGMKKKPALLFSADATKAKSDTLTRADRVKQWVEHSPNALDALIRSTSVMWTGLSEANTDASTVLLEQKTLFGELANDFFNTAAESFWLDRLVDAPAGLSEQNEKWRDVCRSFADWTACNDLTVVDLLNRILARASEVKKDGTGVCKLSEREKNPDSFETYDGNHWLTLTHRVVELRNRTGRMFVKTQELANLAANVRFYDAIVKVASPDGATSVCVGCRQDFDAKSMDISVTCGHTICTACRDASQDTDHCLEKGCDAEISDRTQVSPLRFMHQVTDDQLQFGSRMDAVVKTIDDVLGERPEARILIFVQIHETKEHLIAILKSQEVQHTDGTIDTLTNVEGFKTDGTRKVLIMKMDSVDAAGWNLQTISDVMFIAPLVTGTQHAYRSIMTQAVGRALRYGQTETVYVHHFAMAHTPEVNILEDRNGITLVRRFEGMAAEVLQPGEILPLDQSLRGPTLTENELLSHGEGGEEEDEEGEGGEEAPEDD